MVVVVEVGIIVKEEGKLLMKAVEARGSVLETAVELCLGSCCCDEGWSVKSWHICGMVKMLEIFYTQIY